MTNTIKELMDRKSVRVFEDKEITPEVKREILTAAMAAPTAGNLQLYTIIDVVDQDKKDQLAVLCDNQPFIASGKMVLVFLADYLKWVDAFRSVGCEPRSLGAGDLALAISDACIAAQNAVVAAQSLGIGSCYIGDIVENCAEMRDLLNLPEYIFPCAMIVFGYPTEQQLTRKKPERCKLEDIVCTNTYHRKDAAELKEMLGSKALAKSYEDWLKALCNRKYNTEFSIEMTRSVEEYLKDYLK